MDSSLKIPWPLPVDYSSDSDESEDLQSLSSEESSYKYVDNVDFANSEHSTDVEEPDKNLVCKNLHENFQSAWFNLKEFRMAPPRDITNTAKFGILWEQHLDRITGGLVPAESFNVVSEYFVVREVIWQIFKRHSSVCFQAVGDDLVVVPNVTVSSLRLMIIKKLKERSHATAGENVTADTMIPRNHPLTQAAFHFIIHKACTMKGTPKIVYSQFTWKKGKYFYIFYEITFQSFVEEFLPYIDYFHCLRKFSHMVVSSFDFHIPSTYQNFMGSMQTVIKPLHEALLKLDESVMKQESVYTLVKLASDLRPMRLPLVLLNDIVKNDILQIEDNTTVQCSTTLLYGLRKRLCNVSSKFEQDLYLTLYLASFRYYISVVNSWLRSGDLIDYNKSFIISDNSKGRLTEYIVKDVSAEVLEEPLLKIICTEVVRIGTIVRLVRQLGKHEVFTDCLSDFKDDFYDEFINKVLEQVAAYCGTQLESENVVEAEEEIPISSIFIKVSEENYNYFTEMDKLENLVDTTNPFLMKAFEPYFLKKPEKKVPEKKSLYAKIQTLSKCVFPVVQIPTEVFGQILIRRYEKFGFAVKNLFLHDYKLQEHFLLLQDVFLFRENLFSLFCRRLFKAMEWGTLVTNSLALSSSLQDGIMDQYPNIYDKIIVERDLDLRLADNPVDMCEMLSIRYCLLWPIDVVIKREQIAMYKKLFQFVLKVKWALHVLCGLKFTDHRKAVVPGPILMKMNVLRFKLVNLFSDIQHYFLGYVVLARSMQFSEEIENAYDVESLGKAHSDFIVNVHSVLVDFFGREENNHQFIMMLRIVAKLREFWKNPKPTDVLPKWNTYCMLYHKRVERFSKFPNTD